MRSERAEIQRFGTFEVDVRSGELRRQGVRIKLQEQPFHVLTVLLQRPGEVVTREELRSQNWPADTFVDFDNSLNTAINKLRDRKSTRLNSSHGYISYAVFCLKKKNIHLYQHVYRLSSTSTVTSTLRRIPGNSIPQLSCIGSYTGCDFYYDSGAHSMSYDTSLS